MKKLLLFLLLILAACEKEPESVCKNCTVFVLKDDKITDNTVMTLCDDALDSANGVITVKVLGIHTYKTITVCR